MVKAWSPGDFAGAQLMQFFGGPCYLTSTEDTCPLVDFTASPANIHCSAMGCWLGGTQMNPITVTFSRPVYSLEVRGFGAFYCPGTLGGVRAFNAIGHEVEHVIPQIAFLDDCGADQVTGIIHSALQFPGGIKSLLIDPPGPAEFPVSGATGYITSNPAYFLVETRPPTATSCLTGDELLDQQVVREFLDTLWTLSGGNGLPTQRIERGGYLFEDDAGLLYFKISEIAIGDTACETWNLPAPPPAGHVTVVSVHIHPFHHRESIAVCHPGDNRTFEYEGRRRLGFSSARDQAGNEIGDLGRLANDAINFGPGFRGAFIMDRERIAFAPVGATRVTIDAVGKSWYRVSPGSGCTIS